MHDKWVGVERGQGVSLHVVTAFTSCTFRGKRGHSIPGAQNHEDDILSQTDNIHSNTCYS